MSQPVLVYVDLAGESSLVGRLWTHARGSQQSATFEYDRSWLRSPDRFALEPALSLIEGPYQTQQDKALFGAIGDSAPDRWGRVLMRRAMRKQAVASGHTERTLSERDFLLGVDDEARQGALRFTLQDGGPFLAEGGGDRIPPLTELPRLLAASDNVLREDETSEDLRILLAPGSSLGGAQPKASVRDVSMDLAIAKFPSVNDEYDRVSWEAVALSLAGKAGINTPEMRLESVAGRSVLVVKRFDRLGPIRIPFLSGMSMIGAYDGEIRSYLELADALRQHGANPSRDLLQVWSRIIFTVLVSNVDDHMRNHGFLYEGPQGWVLSPAYDLNPTPVDVKPRILSTAIDFDDPVASIDLAFEVAEYFDISRDRSRAIAERIGQVVATWRAEAGRFGLSRSEIDRMSSAFEHEDLARALG